MPRMKDKDDRPSKVRGAALDAASARHEKLNAAVNLARKKILDTGDVKTTAEFVEQWCMVHYGFGFNTLRNYKKTVMAIVCAEPEVREAIKEFEALEARKHLPVVKV